MAFTVSHSRTNETGAGATTVAVTCGFSVAVGDWLDVAVGWGSPSAEGPSGCADNLPSGGSVNVYTEQTACRSRHASNAQSNTRYTCLVTRAGATPMVTVTFPGSRQFRSISVMRIQGAASVDKAAGQFNNIATAAPSPSVTPDANGELCLSVVNETSNGVSTIGTESTVIINNGATDGFAAQYEVQGTAAAIVGDFTVSPAGGTCVSIITYRPAASGVTVLPGVGAASWDGLAPSVLTPRTVTPGVGAAAWTGFAASVLLPRTVLPGVGAASWDGLAPTVLAPRTVTPGVGAATWTGLAPTVLVPVTVTPGVGVASWDGFAPVVQAGAGITVQPGVGAADWAGLAPTVLTPRTVLPGVGAATWSGFAPAVLSATTVSPGVGAATWDGLAPLVLTPRTVFPGVGAATWTGLAPAVAAGGGVTRQPGVGEADWTGLAPTVLAPVTVRPGVGAAAWAGLAPTVPRVIVVGTGVGLWAGLAPSVGTPVTVPLGVGAATWAGLAPILLQGLPRFGVRLSAITARTSTLAPVVARAPDLTDLTSA